MNDDPRASSGNRRKWWAAGLVAVVALGAGAYYLAVARSIPVVVAHTENNVPVRVFGLGTVEAQVLSKIGFEAGATLVALAADHGDRVVAGQVLARLAVDEQEAKVEKARAALRVAEVNVENARSALTKNQAILASAEAEDQRRQTLVGREIVSEQLADQSLRDVAIAGADVAAASGEIEAAIARIADARAQLRYEETLLTHRTLTAPYDALVIERHMELGTVVKAGDPIFTLMAADSYWGLSYVDEARAGFIEVGQLVEVRLRSRPQETFNGVVARIGLESDRVTEERRVHIRPRDGKRPDQLFLGEQAEFWITVATLDEAVLTPEAAVSGFDGRTGRIWSLEDGTLRQREVAFRHRTEDGLLEIVSGLPKGAQALTQPGPRLRDGMPAHAAEQETEPRAASQ